MFRAFRLAILMVVGAFAGIALLTPAVGNLRVIERQLLPAALVGAIGGFALEMFLRRGNEPEKPFWRFGIRELLVAMSIAAIGLWAIVTLWRLRM